MKKTVDEKCPKCKSKHIKFMSRRNWLTISLIIATIAAVLGILFYPPAFYGMMAAGLLIIITNQASKLRQCSRCNKLWLSRI